MTGLHWAWLAGAAVLGFWMLGAYNRLTALRGAILTAWSVLDAALLARQHAIGALLDATEPSLAGERSATTAMVAAQVQLATAAEVVRRRPTTEEPLQVLAKAEVAITSALTRLLALVEHQSELKRLPEVAAPLQLLAELGPRERLARQVFNDTALAYNQAIDQFPTRLLVRVFGLQRVGSL